MKDANPNTQDIFGGIGHHFQANGTSILVDVLANDHADYLSIILSPPDSDIQTEMHVFEANAHRILVAWVNPLGAEKKQTIDVDGSRAEVVGMFGEVVQVVQDEGDGLLRYSNAPGEPRFHLARQRHRYLSPWPYIADVIAARRRGDVPPPLPKPLSA